ncbi:fasciclin domain-containing protein [Algibacter amylolyticus]|uniref:Fasciclin domain-containing protein n=1 Tax=Algibacter amylolyticus TaxID=1608400 RepID=A0A5M7BCJ7_9FLAO|nr:fasciclin domain-containing protein [Algibacter amylolyticus]KAA5825174.1 fasciclin domain-containing protein [Algibacter amylolyticus]MBB5268713.1 putative surface protein with fasciclin (FAS1) repeats [Algibacter amylolyticus]TSJ77668.1 fasciclin domain-containing protein [Algibacter amylolyticus]
MKTTKLITWIGGLFAFMFILNSCNDNLDGSTFFTTDEMTIAGTLESNPEKFSMYVDILQKTEFYTAFQSYGSYTCFAPTNIAVQEFLQEKWNVSSVDELTSEDQIEFLKIIVKFHTLPTKRAASAFLEGRIDELTYTGDYLTTSFVGGGGIANVEINREAKLDQYDIVTNNGLIHAIDRVLSPFVDAVPKVIEDAGTHTIFVEALKQTGYYDVFSEIYNEDGIRVNFTILAESDAIYAENGINSFADLAAVISPDNSDYLDVNNELNRFIAYHAASDFYYSADFPEDGFVSTVLPKNAIKSLKTDKELKINETETGTNDTWTSLLAEQSNLPAKNGVYHTVNKLLTVFTPKPKYQIFDFPLTPAVGKLAFGKWYGPNEPNEPYSHGYTNPRVFPTGERIRILRQSKNPSYGTPQDGGNTVFNMGGVTWVEWDTPVLPKGKYEVRVCGNTGNNGRPVFQVYWDGQPIGSQWDMRDNLQDVFGSNWKDVDSLTMRQAGYVRGLKTVQTNQGVTAYDSSGWGRFIVTSDLLCPEQRSHVIRFETIRSGGIPIDYVEFVPVN